MDVAAAQPSPLQRAQNLTPVLIDDTTHVSLTRINFGVMPIAFLSAPRNEPLTRCPAVVAIPIHCPFLALRWRSAETC
eukprot:SAG11_NODE_25421_length_359_cov_0.323077_2_plen_77_part_01